MEVSTALEPGRFIDPLEWKLLRRVTAKAFGSAPSVVLYARAFHNCRGLALPPNSHQSLLIRQISAAATEESLVSARIYKRDSATLEKLHEFESHHPNHLLIVSDHVHPLSKQAMRKY